MLPELELGEADTSPSRPLSEGFKVKQTYYSAHKTEVLAQQKNYRAKNVQKVAKCQRLYRRNNKSRLKRKAAIWYKKNKQKVHLYYLKNYERHLRYNAEWARNHPEVGRAIKARRRSKKTKAGGSFSAKQWLNLCKSYNNKCLCCNKRKRLEADHVIPVTKGGSSDISNIQPLCRSCNAIKGTKTIDYRKQPESDAKSIGRN